MPSLDKANKIAAEINERGDVTGEFYAVVIMSPYKISVITYSCTGEFIEALVVKE